MNGHKELYKIACDFMLYDFVNIDDLLGFCPMYYLGGVPKFRKKNLRSLALMMEALFPLKRWHTAKYCIVKPPTTS